MNPLFIAFLYFHQSTTFYSLKRPILIKDLERQEAIQLLQDAYIGYLSYVQGEQPYCLPITYFYSQEHEALFSYATEGHKIKAMRRQPHVTLLVSQIDSVNSWSSVQVHGIFEELKGIDAKYYLHAFSDGVKEVISRVEQEHPKFISEFSSKLDTIGKPIVYRIAVTDITAKYRKD